MSSQPHIYYIALGANLGNSSETLYKITELLDTPCIGSVLKRSKQYTTAPEGFESEHPFCNMALTLSSDLTPQEMLRATRQIERDLGRTQKSVDGIYHDRVADIDIILIDDLILDEIALQVPHPRFRTRRFVLEPLADIAPDAIDPVTGKSIRSLLLDLDNK